MTDKKKKKRTGLKIAGLCLSLLLVAGIFCTVAGHFFPDAKLKVVSSVENLFDKEHVLTGAGASVNKVSDVPKYSGKPYVVINKNVPKFKKSDLNKKSFEKYSKLDKRGRCGVAYANISKDLMPTKERGSISSIKPTGWINKRYPNVEGGYLYNRCHLIGHQLTAEDANRRNLITGTRYLNIEGMLPFENMVADYIHETGNHVLYRVTPVFKGKNLVASGVQMEARSVEDNGDGILFNVYCYNVQPGISINYATGMSKSIAKKSKSTNSAKKSSSSKKVKYILNTNTYKFHLPSCSSVKQMKSSNKKTYTGTRKKLISMGYDPCGRCHP